MIFNLINNKIINLDNLEIVDILQMIKNKDLNLNNLVKGINQCNNIHFTNNNHKNNFILKNNNQLYKYKINLNHLKNHSKYNPKKIFHIEMKMNNYQ